MIKHGNYYINPRMINLIHLSLELEGCMPFVLKIFFNNPKADACFYFKTEEEAQLFANQIWERLENL